MLFPIPYMLRELQEKVGEYETIILNLTHSHDTEMDSVRKEYQAALKEKESMAPAPLEIKKHWVRNVGKKGGHMEWLPHVDKCILELLANRTQPSCVQANMLVMAKVIHPTYDVVKELPSLRYIQRSRTVLLWVTKTLAAMRIAGAKKWKQAHTDETSRRKKSLVNLVMTVLQNNDMLKTICLSGCIIAKDSTADEQAKAIIGQFRESARLLQQWRETTSEMFPDKPWLLDLIPLPEGMCVGRMNGVHVSTDTCNVAQAVQEALALGIRDIAKDLGVSDEDFELFSGYCYQHMRNILVNGVEKIMETDLTQLLEPVLDLMPRHLRIQCGLTNLVRMVDKEINPRGDYAKGHGGEFWHYLSTYHHGVTWLPLIRVLGGSRQDGSFEASLPLYVGRKYIVEFLHMKLCTNEKENILQTNLFIVLECVEMIAQVRIASIFFIAVIVPWRWLAGKCHELGHRDFGEKDMSQICDLVFEAMQAVELDGEKMLDEDFIMSIFSPLYSKVPELEQYLEWYFEEKASYPVGIQKNEERVLAIDEARAELFYPTQACNRQTHECCVRLAEKVGSRACLEFMDTRKSLSMHLSAADGKFSVKNTSEDVRLASIGIRANNDPSEGNFGVFSEAFSYCRGMDIAAAAGLGMVRGNNDMGRNANAMVSGKRSKAERDGEEVLDGEIGLFHRLLIELTDSLIATGKRNAKNLRRAILEALKLQASAREEKVKALQNKKLDAARGVLIDAIYLYQQYNCPRCWKTEEEAFANFEGLKWKKDKLAAVKEQILIRYLGLGWVEAHHAWSYMGHTYTATELLEHFVKVVLPLAEKLEVPSEPPLKLPGLPKSLMHLGTRAQDCIEFETSLGSEEREFRLKALKKIESLEDNGFGDQLEGMQQTLWPVELLQEGGFKIDKLFEYKVGQEASLQWCQGTVVKILKEKEDCFFIVEVEWDKECVSDGDQNKSREKLLKTKWNPEKPGDGAWRQDLRHKLL